ncbi:hypothetical protein SH501x_000998 [Pirellulaceae bacterium SH501]
MARKLFFSRSCLSPLKLIRLPILSLVLASLAGTAAFAQEPENGGEKSAAPNADVVSLVQRLDSNRTSEREDAERELVEMGPEVLEKLPPVRDTDSSEMLLRLERIRSTLESKDQASLLLPTRIELTGTMTGAEALRKIASSSGNAIPLEDTQGLDLTIDARFSKTTFWEAFDEVLDQLNLTVMPGDGESIRLIPQSESAPLRIQSAAYSGPFRLEPIQVTKSSNLSSPDRSTLTIDFLFAWEPRLDPSLITFPAQKLQLLCDNGEILRMRSSQDLSFIPVGGSQLQISLEFPMPSKQAKKIDRLQGVFQAAVPGRMAGVSFSDLTNKRNAKLINGALSVTLEQARKNRDVYELLVAVQHRGAASSGNDSDVSSQAWSTLQDVYILDGKDQKIENVGWSTTRMTEKEMGMSFLFELEKGLEGCKFVFRAPGSLHVQEVDFALVDIPLP